MGTPLDTDNPRPVEGDQPLPTLSIADLRAQLEAQLTRLEVDIEADVANRAAAKAKRDKAIEAAQAAYTKETAEIADRLNSNRAELAEAKRLLSTRKRRDG